MNATEENNHNRFKDIWHLPNAFSKLLCRNKVNIWSNDLKFVQFTCIVKRMVSELVWPRIWADVKKETKKTTLNIEIQDGISIFLESKIIELFI